MSFMKLESFETDYYEIDGPMGIDLVPAELVNAEHLSPSEFDAREWIEGSGPVPLVLRDYCENTQFWTIERKHGWLARYSAPGYMDCTSWVAGETREQAEGYAREHYGDDSEPEEHGCADTREACEKEGDALDRTLCGCSCHESEDT